jgi:DNA-binding SARP family transcriptional activator
MRISVLGSLEIAGPGGVVDVTAPRQRSVLAALLADANRVVTIDHLVDVIWGDAPPSTARSQVHICVSSVRKRLARGGVHSLVVTRQPGYLAAVDSEQLDLHRFDRFVAGGRRLVAAGHFEEAAQHFADALLLWRGRPFAGVDSSRIQSFAAQIGERRLCVVEDYFDLQIRLGRSGTVISDLMAHIEEYPFRERLRAQLIVALCRTGRRGEALGEYREVRTQFADELGLDPGAELRRLERDILAGCPV